MTRAAMVVWVGSSVRARSAKALAARSAVQLAAEMLKVTPQEFAAEVMAWRESYHRLTGEWPGGYMAPTESA